jgi:hypothetical protein
VAILLEFIMACSFLIRSQQPFIPYYFSTFFMPFQSNISNEHKHEKALHYRGLSIFV